MKTETVGLEPLAIVGLGCLFPKAHSPGAYWANIKHGVDGITAVPPTHWKPDDYFDTDPKKPDFTYAQRGGFLEAYDFNPLEFGIAPRDLEATDTSQLLGLVAAKQALTDAGVVFDESQPKGVNRSKVSVILGVTGTLELVIPLGARLGHPHWRKALKDSGVPDDVAQDVVERIAESYVPWQENSFPGLLGNVVAGRIANRLDLHGTNCVVDAACASSLSAVHLAAMELQTGKADVVVTGGVDTFNDIFMFMCFSKTPALSAGGDSKPFDANGDGTILGEGLGMVVLKRLSDAEKAGDTIYAVIKGMGTSSDGKGNAIYAPSAEGQKRCLRDAYTRSGVDPRTVELVEAHGTGTKVGDAAEATALADVYSGVPASQVAIGSVKSMIGHTKAAAGAASLIKVAMALYNKVLPPTLKVTKPVDPLMVPNSPFSVNATMRPWLSKPEHPRRAALSAFGFGGSNFHAVLEEHLPIKKEPDWNGQVELLALSGQTKEELQAKLAALPTMWNDLAIEAEKSRGSFDSKAPERLVFALHRTQSDVPKLFAAATAQLTENSARWTLPGGVAYGKGACPGKLAILFPGQGSQRVGMLRELACTFPEMLASLEAAGATFANAIYPPTSYAPDAATQQEANLRATDVAQPSLGAVSYGAYQVLAKRFGVQAQAYAGHSYGELTALAAAGVVAEADFFKLSLRRGSLMAVQAKHGSGGMKAVIGSPIDLQRVLRDSRSSVVIANRNSPTQTVISGAGAELETLEPSLKKANLRVVSLPVAAAFHSAMVSGAAEPFEQFCKSIEFHPAKALVFSNTTASQYPAETSAAQSLLGQQLAQPVEFVEMIRAMTRSGVRTFLEVGPGQVLTKLVDAILPETSATSDSVAIALDTSLGQRSGLHDLAQVLAVLLARGHDVNSAAWEANSKCRPMAKPTKPVLTVPISGANIVTPRTKRPPKPPMASATTKTNQTNIAKAGTRRMNESTALTNALAMTQQTLAALQAMQQQTAALHKQYLDQQDQAQKTLMALVQQQQALFFPGAAAPVQPPVVVAPAPAPIAFVPPPPALAVVPPPPPVVVPVVPPLPPPYRPAPTPKPIPQAGPNASRIESLLLDVVAEKTGYPANLLNLDMTLDADLGVDSIKRVEILSTLQDKLPEAPVVKSEHMGTLHTLRDVANFLAGTNTETVFPEPVRPKPKPMPMPESMDTVQQPITLQEPISTEFLRSVLDQSEKKAPAPFLPAPASSRFFSASLRKQIETVLLGVVAEKTGYPVEMLNLDMTLESDLGVDSIKRVEILSTIQEKLPDAPVVKPEHLGTLQTLRDVATFLSSNQSGLQPKTEPVDEIRMAKMPESVLIPMPGERKAPNPRGGQVQFEPIPVDKPQQQPARQESTSGSAQRSSTQLGLDIIDRSILQAVDLELKSPRTTIPFPEGSEIWVVAAVDDPILLLLTNELAKLRFLVRTLPWEEPKNMAGNPAGLILISPPDIGTLPINRLAFQWLQHCWPSLRASTKSGSALFVTVSRLDGSFGLTDFDPTVNPISGGLAALVKTVRHEWPEIATKALDLQPTFAESNPLAATQALISEFFQSGPTEVGVSVDHRVAIQLARTSRKNAGGLATFSTKDVVLVTGGGRGVTAEVAVSIAEAFKSTLVLFGRTALPTGPEPGWSENLRDEATLKGAIAGQLGTQATPKVIAEMYSKIVAQREIRNTIRRIEKAGSKVAYYMVDVAKPEQVADVLHMVQVKHGTITGLIHGAGILADRRIEDLTIEQFDSVYTTKVTGLLNLLEFLGSQSLKAILLFSSTTARLGRTGQLAYGVANEVLNKIAQVEARKRPMTRVVSINWGPWEGGMVGPGLKKLFESEGIGLIPLGAGGMFALQELSSTGQAVEVVALGNIRATRKEPEPSEAPAPAISRSLPTQQESTLGLPELSTVFERTLDIPTHPILRSHIIDGRAVLPMALHLEWLAHAALQGNPGLVFHGANEIRVTNGIQIEDGAQVQLKAVAGKAVKRESGLYHVPVELRGRRRDGRELIHSRCEVLLCAELPRAPESNSLPPLQAYPHPLDEIYKYFLFHGPDLHGIEKLDGIAEGGILGTAYPAPSPSEWMTAPLRGHWVTDPLVVDTSFQMMILWSYAEHGAGSLPCFAGRYRQYRHSFPASPVRVSLKVTRDNGTFARADIDLIDLADGGVIATIQDYECLIDPQLNQAFRKNQLTPRVKS